MRRWVLSFLCALVLVECLGLSLVQAQSVTSVVKGRVIDSDGSGLPGVVVVIKSKSQPSGNKQVVTDIEGNYRIPLLPPANDYFIKIDYPGFAPMEMGPLDLDPGKTTVADLTLRSDAETTETIVITGAGNTVDTESTKTASSFNNEFIEGLPLIGRNFQDILTLAPGVTDTDGDGNPNVHGARDTGLQIRLDGGNVTDPVSGTFGQNINTEIIEELEVITSGASPEFGRADGGFANIITKSGGNDFDGKFSMIFRSKFLDGDGANNNDATRFKDELPEFRDLRPSLNLGGAIVRDKLWYFTSFQILDTETPVNQIGSNILVTARGNNSFGKVTWQVNSYNKLAAQVSTDPRTIRGLGLFLGVAPESDFEFEQGGITPQIKWTSTISPQLLLEAQVSTLNSGIAVTPVSPFFEPTEVSRQVIANTVQALYPCQVTNCNPTRGERKTFVVDLVTGSVTGPFNIKSDDERVRNGIKTDLSYSVEDALGQHSIKAGLEFADEKFNNQPTTNPLLIDVTTPAQSGPGGGGQGGGVQDQISGRQVLQVFEPLSTPQQAASFNSSFYAQDSWKPRPNLTVNFGFRVDQEDVDTSGFEFFDPRQERRAAINLWGTICQAFRDQSVVATSNCANANAFNGLPPTDLPDGYLKTDNNGDGIVDLTDPIENTLESLDLNGDGVITTSGQVEGTEGFEFYRDFTRFSDRETENFAIVNTNFSPRLSVSWDPWSDGKTKVFGTWGRFYDRLFLSTVTGEIGPDTINYNFFPDQNQVITPGSPSRAASAVSVTQIDRNLRTPYTDEVTLGIERELAPEWSVGFTFIQRKGFDLLQDTDFNHVTCPQFDLLGIDPSIICGGANGLETDQFGQVNVVGIATAGGDFAFNRGFSGPNQAPDLYTVNNGFNQILRIGNFNSSSFRAYEFRILKRLHRNWQMQANYTWSEAYGQAEGFGQVLGNDPETQDDEEGYLLFDQRHVARFLAVTRLPHDISLGANVQWASGVPFSVIETVVDLDSTGNTIFRGFFPTSQRNDQRNKGQWTIDGRVEKAFSIGRVQASAFLSVTNLLNADDLVIVTRDLAPINGIQLNANRRFGRQFEIGTTFNF